MNVDIEYIYIVDFLLSSEQQKQMKALFEEALQREHREHAEVSITFCDNEFIQTLNRTYRSIDRPTDVLSFPMEEESLLGDIVISVPKTISQAREFGHSFDRELYFLALHGLLHLLGYDHENEDDEKEMFARQDEILAHLGITR